MKRYERFDLSRDILRVVPWGWPGRVWDRVKAMSYREGREREV